MAYLPRRVAGGSEDDEDGGVTGDGRTMGGGSGGIGTGDLGRFTLPRSQGAAEGVVAG